LLEENQHKKAGKHFFCEKQTQKTFVRMSVAAFPMYDFPELRWATDSLWEFLASRLNRDNVIAPASLTRGVPLHALWTDPDLLLAQTCGYPLVTSLAGKVRLVATPCYDAPGCEGPLYRSAIVVRAADPAGSLAGLRGRRCAMNGRDSNSGMNVLRAAVAPLACGAHPFFSEIVETGAHTASAQAVATGRADVAAIDCVTWAHLQHLRPSAVGDLRVLEWTRATPGLPLITSNLTGPTTCGALREALLAVEQQAALAPVCQALRLHRFEAVPLSTYDSILALEQHAQDAAYPTLR
jgi:ABC-type phosphate/phosphonate transport system substrate-binding protein